MADNVSITAGSGTNIATDDVAGVHFQQVKLVDGTLDSSTAVAAGGGAEANALRVTIANDSTGVVSVDDNGSSLTVDGTVTANAGTGNFTVVQATAANLNANVSGTVTANAGTGNFTVTQATAANLNANVVGFGTTLSSGYFKITDGIQTAGLSGTSQIISGFASAATAAFTRLTDGVNSAGLSGTSQIVSGFATAGSAAFTRLTDGVNSAGLSGTSQVVTGFTTTTQFAYVRLTDGVNSSTITSTGGLEVSGSIAAGTADGGNPIKIGAKAMASLATSYADVLNGDRTDVYSDIDGALLVRPYTTSGDIIVQRVFDTGGVSTGFSSFGPTANLRNYLTTLTVYNSSTTNSYVDFRDGTTGTIIYTVPLPALGGATINFPVPLRQPTTNTALAYDVNGAIGSTIISVVGFRAT